MGAALCDGREVITCCKGDISVSSQGRDSISSSVPSNSVANAGLSQHAEPKVLLHGVERPGKSKVPTAGVFWPDCCNVPQATTEILLCLDEAIAVRAGTKEAGEASAKKPVDSRPAGKRSKPGVRRQRLEELYTQLFKLHDLNGNGLLEEAELVELNEEIAMIHYGPDTDRAAVRSKYKTLFRTKFDSLGRPVAYAVFREYAEEVLEGLDPGDVDAQELILEQFVAEAQSGHDAYKLRQGSRCSRLPEPTLDDTAFSRSSWAVSSCQSPSKAGNVSEALLHPNGGRSPRITTPTGDDAASGAGVTKSPPQQQLNVEQREVYVTS